MQQAIPYKSWLPIYANAALNPSPVTDGHPLFHKSSSNKIDVSNMVSENAVIVFARRGCCMGQVMRRLLLGHGVNPALYEIDEEDEVGVLRELERITGGGNKSELKKVQFPVVFIGGSLFGGLDKVMAAHITGERSSPTTKKTDSIRLGILRSILSMAEVARENPCSPTPPAPPPPTRRPRVREVSSRFMSPVSSSSSSSSSAGDLHLLGSKSPFHKQQQQQQQLHRSISVQRQRRSLEMESDENRLNETARSLDSPFQLATQKKNQQRAGGKTLKDNTAGRALRPDTPMLNSVDRMPFSRLRTNHRVTATPTAAAKLLQSSGMSASSAAIQDGNQRNSGSDLSADMLPIVSSSNSLKFSASPFSRSLNSPFSTCEPSLFHPVKPLKTDLPPVPPPAKLTTDTRKAKKISSHQEDVHSLKLLYNHYLLWRYANAKAETAMCAQKRDAQRALYSLGLKMSDLHASVQRKRIELRSLQRTITLSTILKAQMWSLEDWSTLEGDYSHSLSETIQALSNVSTRLPFSSNIKVDIGDVGEALNSAVKVMETILLHIQNFVPKAEELEKLISELARVIGGQRVEIQECGDLLSQTYALQVEECSLRSQLIQFHRSCPDIKQ